MFLNVLMYFKKHPTLQFNSALNFTRNSYISEQAIKAISSKSTDRLLYPFYPRPADIQLLSILFAYVWV